MTETTGQYVHRQAAYSMVVNGQDISAALRPRLISLNLTEKRGTEADDLDIVIDDADGRMAIPPSGARISLKLGWRNLGGDGSTTLIDKGVFKVARRRHSGSPDRITITARSADLTRQFRKLQTSSWSNTTLGAVLREVAGRNGWQPMIAPDLASVALPHLDQARESDAALLSRLGRLHDAIATVKAERLIFSPIGAGVTAGGAPIPRASITRQSGDSHDWECEDRDAYSGVIATWHDRASGRRRQVVAGSEANAKKLRRTYDSEARARTAADAEWEKTQRAAARFSLSLALGRPDLYPDRTLDVSGFKPEIDSSAWLIDSLRHTLDANGLRTQLQMELGKPKSG